MLIYAVSGWVVLGLILAVWVWTADLDLELGDLPIIVFYGVLAGPAVCLIWWYLGWLQKKRASHLVHKVLMKRRY